jgi:hypothetical protein
MPSAVSAVRAVARLLELSKGLGAIIFIILENAKLLYYRLDGFNNLLNHGRSMGKVFLELPSNTLDGGIKITIA